MKPTVVGPNAGELSAEIARLSKTNDLSEGLSRLGISVPRSEHIEVRADKGWYRGGAETYLLPWTIQGESFRERLLFKACVAFGVATTIEAILNKWVERRKRLASANVLVPRLFYVGEGLLLEEYIEGEFTTAFQQDPANFYQQFLALVAITTRLGFRPVRLAGDLRVRDDRVVMVDFGEDLGEPLTSSDLTWRRNVAAQLNEEISRLFPVFSRERNVSQDLLLATGSQQYTAH